VVPQLVLVLSSPAHRTRAALAVAGGWLRTVLALRAQVAAAIVVALLFLALGGDTGLPVDDAIMRWLEGPRHGVLAVLAALATAWLLVVTGVACWCAYQEPPSAAATAPSRRRPVAVMLAGVLLLGIGVDLALFRHRSVGFALVFPGATLALLSL